MSTSLPASSASAASSRLAASSAPGAALLFGAPLAAADLAALVVLDFVAAAALLLPLLAAASMGLISPLLETVAMISGSTLEMTRLVAAGLMAVDERGGSGEAAGSAQDRVVGGPGWPGKVQAAGCKERCPRGLEPAGGCSPERTHRPRGSRCWVAEGEDGSLSLRAVAVIVVGRRCRRKGRRRDSAVRGGRGPEEPGGPASQSRVFPLDGTLSGSDSSPVDCPTFAS